MNRKAQSALEYLMTYGWALIVIAIVIGILWYVTSSATGGTTCMSRSNNFTVKASAVSSTGVSISLQNGTGYLLTSVSAAPGSSSVFTGTAGLYDVNGHENLSGSVPINGTFVISGLTSPTSGTSFDNGLVTVTASYAGLSNVKFDVVCSGKV